MSYTCRSNGVRLSLHSACLPSVAANYCMLFEDVRMDIALESQLSVNLADLGSKVSVQNCVFSHLTVESLINSPTSII